MIKGILLDIDGTLVDSNTAHTNAWVESFAKFGHDVTHEIINPLMGMGGDLLIPSVFPDMDKAETEEISSYRKKLFIKNYAKDLRPTKGARKLVEALKERNLKLVVATSASSEELQTLLQAANVADLLDTYTTASDVANSKPEPDIVSAALKKIDINPKEALMIGDTPYDIAAAAKCNVSVIALRSGGFSEEQLKNAYALYDDPEDLIDHLDEVLNEDKTSNKQFGKWKLLGSKTVYQNPWIKVIEDDVIQPDKKRGKYGVVYMVPGVSVLPIDEDSNVYITEEYRYAFKNMSIEVISGGIEENEKPLQTAKRELQEEVGLKAKSFTYLGVINPFTSVIQSPNHLYIARDLTPVKRNLDPTEDIKIHKIPLTTALEWVTEGKITHAASIVLLLYAKDLKDNYFSGV